MDDSKFLVDEGLERSEPICHSCKHWNKDLTCKAFPSGIPRGILVGYIDHTKPVKGDNGIQYEKIN
jgi:hypothetical protein